MVVLKLAIGITLVLYGTNLLINTATILGKKFNISDFFIGIVVIGFGTSLCELVVSIDAVLKNATELSLGNIIGSNIANIFLVLGFSGLMKKIVIPKIKNFDIIFHFFISSIFFLIFLFLKINFLIGIIFIGIFLLYIIKSFYKSDIDKNSENINLEDRLSILSFDHPIKFGVPIIFFSIALTIYGADLTVINAIEISTLLGVSEAIIGLSIVAVGTSLPEIAAGIAAVKKNKIELIFGNIIGSNLYNILLIVGTSSLLNKFDYNNQNLLIEIWLMFISVIIFSIIIKYSKKIDRIFSVVLLILYFIFMTMLYSKNLT
ncbi:MAG: hypothetical protein CMP25_01135 [Rickettsiales bacterium]|nr:hypothetical protein [Rickettsiales bacterium]|tara:strand:- start:2168 stop:3121 length:954 start_codon:yes stop_codon:yes gene_type:complete